MLQGRHIVVGQKFGELVAPMVSTAAAKAVGRTEMTFLASV